MWHSWRLLLTEKLDDFGYAYAESVEVQFMLIQFENMVHDKMGHEKRKGQRVLKSRMQGENTHHCEKIIADNFSIRKDNH